MSCTFSSRRGKSEGKLPSLERDGANIHSLSPQMQIDGGGGGGTQVELRRPVPAFAKPLDAPPAAGGEQRRGRRRRRRREGSGGEGSRELRRRRALEEDGALPPSPNNLTGQIGQVLTFQLALFASCS